MHFGRVQNTPISASELHLGEAGTLLFWGDEDDYSETRFLQDLTLYIHIRASNNLSLIKVGILIVHV